MRRPTLNTEPLFADELVLLGPASDPAEIGGEVVAAARLGTLPLEFCRHGRMGYGYSSMTCWISLGLVATIELEVDAMTMTLSLVEQGAGRPSCRRQQRNTCSAPTRSAPGRSSIR